jgi:threonine dehydratase
MKFVWERMKLVIESSAAVPLAVALFSEEFRETMKGRESTHEDGHLNVGIVFSGGNVDLNVVSKLFEQV